MFEIIKDNAINLLFNAAFSKANIEKGIIDYADNSVGCRNAHTVRSFYVKHSHPNMGEGFAKVKSINNVINTSKNVVVDLNKFKSKEVNTFTFSNGGVVNEEALLEINGLRNIYIDFDFTSLSLPLLEKLYELGVNLFIDHYSTFRKENRSFVKRYCKRVKERRYVHSKYTKHRATVYDVVGTDSFYVGLLDTNGVERIDLKGLSELRFVELISLCSSKEIVNIEEVKKLKSLVDLRLGTLPKETGLEVFAGLTVDVLTLYDPIDDLSGLEALDVTKRIFVKEKNLTKESHVVLLDYAESQDIAVLIDVG